jgi:hypothetical protein
MLFRPLALLPICLLVGCSSTRPEAPPTGPFHLRYDGDQESAQAALLEALDAHRFVVAHAESDLGVLRTAPQPLRLVDAPPTGAPDTVQVWFRLAEGQDGRTVVAARPLLSTSVPRDFQDSTSAAVPLLADLPATHPLARTVVGQLAEAGFTLLPRRAGGYAGVFLGHEVYDAQP